MNLSQICQRYFLLIVLGILLANAQRRTVTAWISAAKLFQSFRNVFYHLPQIDNRLKPYFAGFDRRIKLIVDGGYAKKSVLVPLSQEENVCVITRIRKGVCPRIIDVMVNTAKIGSASRPY
ncbi:MAG: hypothetical protein LBU65_08885 [Planctomycetaceae bacterium]|jgi:hypothetical protein|nr:hypothetical protein [Planctomycetaceae bacterium]